MFGYLLPDKQELKVKDFALYRAAYCGVCRAIKLAYGDLPRLAVSWDAAVLAVLMIGASGLEPKVKNRGCVLNPVQKKPVLEGHAVLRYMAAVSVMLARERLKDAWADEKRFSALPAAAALALADRKARRGFPAAAALITERLAELAALEKNGCKEIDRPADAMGNMLSGILTSGPVAGPAAEVLLRSMGYHLGRWTYLVDALDDREKDAKSGAYNPIRAMGGGEGSVELAEQACLYAASQAAAVFDLLDMRWGGEVITNVLYSGMPRIFDKVTNKEKEKDGRPVEDAGSQAGLKR
jgi:hypothetical protein